jgi:hypothetical protein
LTLSTPRRHASCPVHRRTLFGLSSAQTVISDWNSIKLYQAHISESKWNINWGGGLEDHQASDWEYGKYRFNFLKKKCTINPEKIK